MATLPARNTLPLVPRLVPGAPGSGYVSQFTDAGLPGAGAMYTLVPGGNRDINPARTAALSAAYLNPANWRHQGGDLGLIGAGAGGGMFQPDLNAINRAAAGALAAPPPNRYAGLVIGDTPGGAQQAVLGVRGQALQGLQMDRNYALALENLRRQDNQQAFQNRMAELTFQANLGNQQAQQELARLRLGLEDRQMTAAERTAALTEMKALNELGAGGPQQYTRALEQVAGQQKEALQTQTQALRDLQQEASRIAQTLDAVTPVDNGGIPGLAFDPRLGGNDPKFNPLEAHRKFQAEYAKFVNSPAMQALNEASARLEMLEIQQQQINENAQRRIPMAAGGQQPDYVWDAQAGRFVRASRSGGQLPNIPPGVPVPLARTILPTGTTPNPRFPQPALGIPYGSAPAILERRRNPVMPAVELMGPDLPVLPPIAPSPMPSAALPTTVPGPFDAAIAQLLSSVPFVGPVQPEFAPSVTTDQLQQALLQRLR